MTDDSEFRRTFTSFDIGRCHGEIDVSERTGAGPAYSTASILKIELDEIEFSFGVREDEDGIFLTLSAYHIKDEHTGKVFHVHNEIVLTLADIKRFHAYLGFLIASGLDGVSND